MILFTFFTTSQYIGKKIIDNKPAGVFITTIQKFRELGNRKDSRDNVIILIDEAHRTQYGDFQVELLLDLHLREHLSRKLIENLVLLKTKR